MPSSRLAAVQKSTIVRSFRACWSGLAPAVGARWAEALWFTVLAPAAAAIGRPPPAARSRWRLCGRAVAGEVWGGRRAGGRLPGARMGRVGAAAGRLRASLVEAGAWWSPSMRPATVPPDRGPVGAGSRHYPGVRRRPGRGGGGQGPGPRGGRAHSLGATAAAFALRGGLPVERAAFLALMADPLPYTRTVRGRLGFGERVRTRLVDRIERRVGLAPSAFDVRPAMAELGRHPAPAAGPRPPGRRDRLVRQRGHRPLLAAVPAGHHRRGLGHRRISSSSRR